jgi:hypothetical protein
MIEENEAARLVRPHQERLQAARPAAGIGIRISSRTSSAAPAAPGQSPRQSANATAIRHRWKGLNAFSG